MVSGLSASTSENPLLSPAYDLLMKTLIKTFTTPIAINEAKAKFSVEIMLANDVFTLDDALRIFIQQFLLALYDGNYHYIPDDWQIEYPAYARIIGEINNILDLLAERTLSKISMKDIRPFVESLTPTAFIDLQRLIKAAAEREKLNNNNEEEEHKEEDTPKKIYTMTTNKVSPIITKDTLKTIFDNISENELFVCSLCACMCTNQNKHQLVSTKCGHLFGKNCIRKRLKETGQCPLCLKQLETRRDKQLRTMCLSSVVTIFPFEISQMRDERKQLRIRLNEINKRLERAKLKLNSNKKRLQIINKKILKKCKHIKNI
ncbi:unnamed protein product [Adineta steineri]|uniref:RING-type domain-containing protein n=1 Tax=Adineta steineri TaxID=433720 RepID=A0A818RWM0_9BILA|nr:unnamed protein product [Adineta steineri]